VRVALTLLIVVLAFFLGMLGERWLHGGEREEVLRRYERAVSDYGGGPVPLPSR
jgi:hypothetical protein